MVVRVLVVFLIVCLAFVYGLSSFNNTINLELDNVSTLAITEPDSTQLAFDISDSSDKETLDKLVNWYDEGKVDGIDFNPSFSSDYTVFTWKLKNGKTLKMYAAKDFDGYIVAKDLRLPLAYKLKVADSPELQGLRVFVSAK